MPPGWLLTRAFVPRAARLSAHARLPLRKAGDYPVAIVSVSLERMEDGRARSARIAVGSVEPVARRWPALEQALEGRQSIPARPPTWRGKGPGISPDATASKRRAGTDAGSPEPGALRFPVPPGASDYVAFADDNGEAFVADRDPMTPLIDILREDLVLTGSKAVCREGFCGACMVLIDGEPVASCLTPAALAVGRQILTIEGVSRRTSRRRCRRRSKRTTSFNAACASRE